MSVSMKYGVWIALTGVALVEKGVSARR